MKQSAKRGRKNLIGAYGEEITVRYLKRLGWKIIDINYLKPWGEIDVIATDEQNIIHFIEVKAVSYETKACHKRAVSQANYRPEDNVHPIKLRRLQRTIETWLAEQNCDQLWQLDVAAVRIVPCEKYATIKFIPNVI